MEPVIRETAELVLISIKKECNNCFFFIDHTIVSNGDSYILKDAPSCGKNNIEFNTVHLCDVYKFVGITFKKTHTIRRRKII